MELRTDQAKNIAYIRLTGPLHSATILEAFDAAVADSGYRMGMVAFVASRKLEFGLSRMFEAFSADAKTKIAVFYAMAEAEAWLAE